MRLRELRKAAGLTQAALAERAGLNNRMVSYYEEGAKDINRAEAANVQRLADVLGCTVNDLLERDEHGALL